jgi:integrase
VVLNCRAIPDFHALRHGAAMDCDDAEEARDLLRHKNSNATRAIYRRGAQPRHMARPPPELESAITRWAYDLNQEFAAAV